jgi:hypothetical protein
MTRNRICLAAIVLFTPLFGACRGSEPQNEAIPAEVADFGTTSTA